MSAPVLLGVGALGGLGAVARALATGAVLRRRPIPFPLGTFLVNMAGSFALGVLVGASLHGDALRLAATGFIGAFTTFSTWVFDSERLAGRGQAAIAAANVALSLAVGLLSVFAGRALGTAL